MSVDDPQLRHAGGYGGAASTQPARLALTRAEAARALGMSIDSFERYVQPELRLVRRGKLRLIPVAEIERWLVENASRTLDTGRL
jgi:hypothetical protein